MEKVAKYAKNKKCAKSRLIGFLSSFLWAKQLETSVRFMGSMCKYIKHFRRMTINWKTTLQANTSLDAKHQIYTVDFSGRATSIVRPT